MFLSKLTKHLPRDILDGTRSLQKVKRLAVERVQLQAVGGRVDALCVRGEGEIWVRGDGGRGGGRETDAAGVEVEEDDVE